MIFKNQARYQTDTIWPQVGIANFCYASGVFDTKDSTKFMVDNLAAGEHTTTIWLNSLKDALHLDASKECSLIFVSMDNTTTVPYDTVVYLSSLEVSYI